VTAIAAMIGLTIMAGFVLAIVVIAVVCAVRQGAKYDDSLPAIQGPYYCEGPLYDRSHCYEAGLFQCPDCRKEQQLNGRPQ
jgi:hypothetical protein